MLCFGHRIASETWILNRSAKQIGLSISVTENLEIQIKIGKKQNYYNSYK